MVGPTGATLVFMSDIGGANASPSVIDLTFDDAAATVAPATVITTTSTFKPTNQPVGTPVADTWVSPAPAGPYNDAAPTGAATFFSVFGSTNPNGDWKLYVIDDVGGDSGAFDRAGNSTSRLSLLGSPTTTTVTSSVEPFLNDASGNIHRYRAKDER